MSTSVFPSFPGLEWPVDRAPSFATTIVTNYSGKEIRVGRQSTPRRTWTSSYSVLRQGAFQGANYTEQAQFEGFFNNRTGMLDSFLYSDPNDNAVVNQTIGVGDGSTIQFQLIRAYGGAVEPILAPQNVTSLTVGGGAKVNGTDFGVGAWENGVTPPGTINFFTGAPGVGQPIVATFSYYFPVRFTDDAMTFSNFMQSLFENKKVSFIQIK
jgi:uncharacterized protein (TIGR02217 family)